MLSAVHTPPDDVEGAHLFMHAVKQKSKCGKHSRHSYLSSLCFFFLANFSSDNKIIVTTSSRECVSWPRGQLEHSLCSVYKEANETGSKFLLPNCSLLKFRVGRDSQPGLSGGERLPSNLERDCFPADQSTDKLLIKNKEDGLFTFVPKYVKKYLVLIPSPQILLKARDINITAYLTLN